MTSTAPSPRTASVARGSGVAVVDPVSGELVEAAPAGAGLGLENALSTSSDGLVAEELPDGSVRVHLQGRFRHAAFATVDAGGRVAVSHQIPVTGPAAAPIEAPGCVESESPPEGDDDARR